MNLRRDFSGVSKLRHYLQVVAFTLVVATLQYAFMPDKPYGPPVVYSVLIGTFTWAIIDLGRELIPSAAETGWPQGWQGIALVIAGIVVGYVAGTLLADALCVYYFHFYPAGASLSGADQRTSILITAIAGLVGSYYFYAIHKSAYLEDKMAEARMHATEARLKLLETQLEPHMLFNTLANLRALISSDPTRALAMLDRFDSFLRATLQASRSGPGHHTLADEFDRLADYLAIMEVRMGPRLTHSLDLPPHLRHHPVPALLLQPLVENTIRHGLEPSVAGGHVAVAAREVDGALQLVVQDNGVGCADGPGAGSGFGLAQVRERLASAHGAAAHCDWHSRPGEGTRVTLRLPLSTAHADTTARAA